MKHFWLQRSLREKIFLVMGFLVVLVAGWLQFINPLLQNNSLNQNKQQFQNYVSFINWANHVAPFTKPLREINPALFNSPTKNWENQIKLSLKQGPLGEALISIKQNNGQLTLVFKHALFTALLQKCQQWQLLGAKILTFTSERSEDEGFSNVTVMVALPHQGART